MRRFNVIIQANSPAGQERNAERKRKKNVTTVQTNVFQVRRGYTSKEIHAFELFDNNKATFSNIKKKKKYNGYGVIHGI